MGITEVVSARGGLDDLGIEVYRHLLRTGLCPRPEDLPAVEATSERIRAAVETLVSLRVVIPAEDRDSHWITRSPDEAMLDVVLPREARNRQDAVDTARLRRGLEFLGPLFDEEHAQPHRPAIEIPGSHASVVELIRAEYDRASGEVLAFVGGLPTGTPDTEPSHVDRDTQLRALERGVELRSILRHSARFHLPSIGLMETLAAEGAAFRTIGEVLAPALVFDRRVCVVTVRGWHPTDEPDSRHQPTGDASTTILFRHPAIVHHFAELFNAAWDRGARYDPDRVQSPDIPDRTKEVVLRLMATGAKDEVIARRLGMSVRSCRRHIADVMASLGADSRFQAGMEAQRRGLLGS